MPRNDRTPADGNLVECKLVKPVFAKQIRLSSDLYDPTRARMERVHCGPASELNVITLVPTDKMEILPEPNLEINVMVIMNKLNTGFSYVFLSSIHSDTKFTSK